MGGPGLQEGGEAKRALLLHWFTGCLISLVFEYEYLGGCGWSFTRECQYHHLKAFCYFMDSCNCVNPKHMKPSRKKTPGTFVQHLHPKYHNKQVRTFIPQPLRGGLQHPLHRQAFWGAKRFSSLLQHKEECGFHWCCPDHEAPLPHTPSHLIFLCYVCSCSLVLILKTLIYIHLKSQTIKK